MLSSENRRQSVATHVAPTNSAASGLRQEPRLELRRRQRRAGHEALHLVALEQLQQARLLLMPSIWFEGFGLIAMEAMLRGLPVIASDMGGLRETVRHEQNGLVCDPADEHSLRDAMLRLYEDSELYSRMAAAARPSAERFLQPMRMVDEYQQLLKTIESA